ncbi:hypothetical protein JN535_16220 [Cellulosimicrobium cellulans]|uniref:hypothetical protein n=1 Tax=Cellulosimicrobium cellulans TaxID=1710 RepID=UPI0019650752|nr:hypothetical protein [Cellulosimicrobium cellulans]MBN0041708.1 hypothetical protein [Cellulosimicrobium cellulans]
MAAATLTAAILGAAACAQVEVPDGVATPVPPADASGRQPYEQPDPAPRTDDSATTSDAIYDRYGADPRFGTLALAEGGTGLVLYWHGDAPDDLAELAGDTAVEVVQTPYLPADLRAAVLALFESGTAHGPVTMGGPSVDGSGIEIGIEKELTPSPEERLGESLSDEVGVPVVVESGARVSPAVG